MDRHGIGLGNTIERFQVLFGKQRVTLRWPEEGGCVVDLELPFVVSAITQAKEEESACEL